MSSAVQADDLDRPLGSLSTPALLKITAICKKVLVSKVCKIGVFGWYLIFGLGRMRTGFGCSTNLGTAYEDRGNQKDLFLQVLPHFVVQASLGCMLLPCSRECFKHLEVTW